VPVFYVLPDLLTVTVIPSYTVLGIALPGIVIVVPVKVYTPFVKVGLAN